MLSVRHNIGRPDRALRVVIGLLLLPFGLAPDASTWWAWLGLYPLVTGLVGHCPLYEALRRSTTHPA
jgi:hypothetical protein